MMHRKMRFVAAVAVLAMGLMAAAGVSYAQYPSPTGGITVKSDATVVAPGGNTTVTCEVHTSSGEAVPNTACTMTIESEPGNDAALGSKTVTKITNAQGIATTNLYVGTTPGLIIIGASSGGYTSSVIVSVEGAVPSPPQAPVGSIQPPSTGSGGLLDAD